MISQKTQFKLETFSFDVKRVNLEFYAVNDFDFSPTNVR